MNVLVIDQATVKTSYTIIAIRNGEPNWIECSKLLLQSLDYQERIAELYDRVDILIKEYKIDVLVIEQVPPVISNFHTTSVLLKLVGVLELLCKQHKIECVSMNIIHWKSVAGIKAKGRALQKRESISLAWDRWVAYQEIIKDSDDVADALNMSYAYLVDEGYIKLKKKK